MAGLLAKLVASRGWPPEPVATDALVALLAEPKLKAAFGVWADGVLPDLDSGSFDYKGQVLDPSKGGRPDLVGYCGNDCRLVLEAKFAASFTPAQRSGAYANHLSTAHPGLLVYLVPNDRVLAAWSAAASMHPSSTEIPATGDGRRRDLGGGHAVTVLSWPKLLSILGAAAEGTATDDVAQLRGLVDWRSATTWVPVLPDDLSDRVGRQLTGLSDVVLRAANNALTARARPGTTDHGPGRYVTTEGGQRTFWVGIWFDAWACHGRSPVWAAAHQGTDLETLRAGLEAASGRKALTFGSWAVQPLLLGHADEEVEAEERLRHDINAFATALDSVSQIAPDIPADDPLAAR